MAATRTRYPAGISRNTVLLAFASLFADISSEMLYPILPIFLTQVLHASGSVVGVVEGIAEATQNVVQGFSGWLSDKLQKRKALALIGYFVSALGKPLMGIATAWPGVLGGRFLDRFGAGFRSAPRDALIASSVSDEYRGRAFGLEGIGDNLGAFLGPLLAVLLFLSFHFEIRWIFLLAIVPGLLAFLMILLASFVIFFVAYLGFARTRSVVAIAVLFVFYGLFQGIFRSVGKALASDFVPELLRASAVGWYSAVVGLLELVASVVAGLLWDHVSHAAVFYYGAIFAIAGSVGLLFIPGKRNRSAVDA